MGGAVWSLKDGSGGQRFHASCAGDLPIGEPLIKAIDEWFEDYMAWCSDDYRNPKCDPGFPFEDFNGRGEALAVRCRRELGREWSVTHLPAEPLEK